jgi:hypothetical protein
MIFPASGERQKHRYTFPARAWFEYHCWESEDSADAELWRRTHQRITVLRMLSPNESDYEMYEVRFADGYKGHVFADELMHTRKNFERPDYPGMVDRNPNKEVSLTKAGNSLD